MEDGTIKERIFWELGKNPMLLPKQLCKLTNLDYSYYYNYVTKLRSEWKSLLKDRQGLKGLKDGKFKNWQGWVYAPPSIDPKNAVEAGWIQTKAKNKYLLWKSKLGRLEWHPKTRRIRIWVKKPASLGKANQLVSDGFFNTGLIYDLRLLEPFLQSVRFKRATYILETSQRLPYFKIDFLKDSNGIIIKAGDRSHPNCFEITFFYPDWGEKAEGVIAKLNYTLEKLLTPKKPTKENVSYRV